jgi:hypothetical protein
MTDSHIHMPRLNNRLKRIGVTVKNNKARSRFRRICAKTARRVRNIRPRKPTHRKTTCLLKLLLRPRKMLNLLNRPGADDNILLTFQDGLCQILYILRFILIVAVRINNNVRTQFQRPAKPLRKRSRQAAI